MDSYLNKDAIIDASSLLNDTLISKGYVDSTLLFNSIDWDKLKVDQPSDIPQLKLTDTLYNNDKNIINIIYGLLQSVERNKVQNKTFNQIINQKDQEIKQLKERTADLELKLNKSDSKLQTALYEKSSTSKDYNSLANRNKAQARDLNKVKNWCNDIKTKHEIEIKKKNLVINNLKNQLIEKKNLSTSITYGLNRSSLLEEKHEIAEVDTNSNYIYNNNPIINNLNDTNLPIPILNAEYEKIVITLTDLTNNLIKENHKFSRFIKNLNKYYSRFNSVINPETDKPSSQDEFIPNPEDYFNLQDLNQLIDSDLDIDNIETFEFIIKPILNNIYKNYHYLNNLFDDINQSKEQPPEGAESRDGKDDEIQRLKRELSLATSNWKDAIKTLDDWEGRNRRH
ncbi:hypothetical protein CANTEDRAFT_103989 [Yamadazyma tenuis ATCC 10573]|uniref:Autophagy-related protein 25 n=2 Tax=Candida tenuis TaxID=2315449 RepID=G3B2B1_CANTC|nr:uncharacterized protein CANTEDRAFT_103989 [Yamadazyma tenuis ATCC 10573]EGV64635.1 hypothetical protein CANTEDRAFT_103989 [Yamadazyma tenuis ATCC 10573]